VETDKEFSVWSPLARIRVRKTKVIPEFMYYVLQSQYIQEQVQKTWSAGTQPNISMGSMERLYIVLPSAKEQTSILHYIVKEVEKIDRIIQRTLHEIDLIQEYRTRLISDIVSGKVDVRGIEIIDNTTDKIQNEINEPGDHDVKTGSG
jgi:type I restriction enzyme S subunit